MIYNHLNKRGCGMKNKCICSFLCWFSVFSIYGTSWRNENCTIVNKTDAEIIYSLSIYNVGIASFKTFDNLRRRIVMDIEHIDLSTDENRELKNRIEEYESRSDHKWTTVDLVRTNYILSPESDIVGYNSMLFNQNSDELFRCSQGLRKILDMPHLQVFDYFVKEFVVYDHNGDVIMTKEDINEHTLVAYEDLIDYSVIEITSEIVKTGRQKYRGLPKFNGKVVNDPLTLFHIENNTRYITELYFEFKDQRTWFTCLGRSNSYSIVSLRDERLRTVDDFLAYLTGLTIYAFAENFRSANPSGYLFMSYEDILRSNGIKLEQQPHAGEYSHIIFTLCLTSEDGEFYRKNRDDAARIDIIEMREKYARKGY
jgi:hypothetical protein